jgi:hypothetical protein
MHGGDERYIKNLVGKPEGRAHSEVIDVDRKIILE